MKETRKDAIKVLEDAVENVKEAIRREAELNRVKSGDVKKHRWSVYRTADFLCESGFITEEEAEDAKEEIYVFGCKVFHK